MDTVGYIKDPTVRVIPSTKFEEYLNKIEYNDSMPEMLKRFKKKDTDDENKYLIIDDLKWLLKYLEGTDNENHTVYLHELLEDSDVVLPDNEVIKRNPQLEARCERLRKNQMNRDYRAMTKNVDNVRVKHPEETILMLFYFSVKNLNKQLIAVFQFVLSVAAGFLFGFMGVELIIGRLDFGFRLLLGIICALIIALAEIYFLAKKLNEEYIITESIQLGGPTQFTDKLHKD